MRSAAAGLPEWVVLVIVFVGCLVVFGSFIKPKKEPFRDTAPEPPTSHDAVPSRSTSAREQARVMRLIDTAEKAAGTFPALAEALGVTPRDLGDWRTGRRVCPIDLRARLAEMAGDDPFVEIVNTITARLSDDRKRALLAAIKRSAKAFAD